MRALVAGLIFIPLLDHALKSWMLARRGDRAIALGVWGELRARPARLWMNRGAARPAPQVLWMIWSVAAGALVAAAWRFPGCGWAAGALLGGSLSHAIESSVRGWICDYVCLRFWPAFNFADACITAGAIGCGVSFWLALPLFSAA